MPYCIGDAEKDPNIENYPLVVKMSRCSFAVSTEAEMSFRMTASWSVRSRAEGLRSLRKLELSLASYGPSLPV